MGGGGVVSAEPRVLHTITGRVRVHVPGWTGQGKQQIEAQLRQLDGVRRLQANPVTGTILVTFDPAILGEQTILQTVQKLDLEHLNRQPAAPASPHVSREKRGKTVRARIAVRGLDRDPTLAKRVVEQLEKHSGIHASANPLTGRVLVEFSEHEAELEDLIAQVADLELPDLVGEDRPAYPLDPTPLIQGSMRTTGTALGLGFLATRRALGQEGALPGEEAAAYTASIIGLLQSFPALRQGVHRSIGRVGADILLSLPGIVLLTLARSPLGLAVAGAESLRLLTEVQARRTAWKAHEARVAKAPTAQPDAILHLESGERVPLAARVHEGTGTATGLDSMPLPAYPGAMLPPGALLYGGPFTVQLNSEATFQGFASQQRPAPVMPTLSEHYQRILAPTSLAYAGLVGLLTRSLSQAFAALLLVNPRTALIGTESANLHASARILRARVTVVGTRPGRPVRLPHLVLLDGARLLTEKLELTNVLPLDESISAQDTLARAAGIANAAGLPWGGIFHSTRPVAASAGRFDGTVAQATVNTVRYTLGPLTDWGIVPESAYLRQRGNYVLALCQEGKEKPLALLALRPRLATSVPSLVNACKRFGVELALLSQGNELALREIAHRAHISLIESDSALTVIKQRQQAGKLVAYVSDHAGAAAGFAACDLAIGLTDDRSRLAARADLLAPDLAAVVAILEAGARRDATVRDSVVLSIASNLAGVAWGWKARPGVMTASRVVYGAALGALADGWLRLRGDKHARSTITRLVDPHPERWGRRSVEDVLHQLNATEQGLTSKQARARLRKAPELRTRSAWQVALAEQIRSPLTIILAAGATLSLLFGSLGDVAIIGATIATNMVVGIWQERKADQMTETLRRIGTSQARVLRDGQVKTLSAEELVPGDILLLAAGDRIAADARVIDAHGLEVDEAALTGESFPVNKYSAGGSESGLIVLEGSDVTTGNGRAVVVAVGEQTRMGATRLALAGGKELISPLGERLSRILRLFLPISAAGGVTVIAAGLLWKRPLTALLATGATIALAGVPEGLPLLSRVGEAGVARRLAKQRAIVRRLSSVEALGRVDVVCTDKTGTMTRGQLQLGVVADPRQECSPTPGMPATLVHILLTAALASPHPEAQGARAHPTDVAVFQGAERAGLRSQASLLRTAELAFDPIRSFHATIAQGRLCIKGAPEVILARCRSLKQDGTQRPLDQDERTLLLQRSRQLARRGLRVLMVAEGAEDQPLENPQDLTALGFVGISDPLRTTVKDAVKRCQKAGVRVVMITGDHPETAHVIGREAGLLNGGGEVLNATEIADLQNGDLDQRLRHVAVIARATPLDKVRIVESLRRQGHTVAMTGDGVNDAPALRLADIGLAMGIGGTEVARQTADVVILDDDFSTIVKGFVEGRSFWRNMRRALGLLLGGNLGELGLVVGASLLGSSMPLTVGQILAVNAITDILPAMAVILQEPEHSDLRRLQREGMDALNVPLLREVMKRGLATALPSLAAYLITLSTGSLPQARSVAFASIITTQLAQTVIAGRAEGHLTRPVLGAVGGSLTVLLASFSIPSLRRLLNLVLLPPPAWGLIAGGTLAALLLNRLLNVTDQQTNGQKEEHLALALAS